MYNKVADYCQKNGLSISAFEKKCDLGNATVAGWKDGKKTPNLTTIQRIAEHTGTKVSDWI